MPARYQSKEITTKGSNKTREVWFRSDTTDERVLIEVVEKRCYRKPSIGFEVEKGERWLDLGANIGAFAVYCSLMGATTDSYEPEAGCFKLLQRNSSSRCVQAVVTSSKEKRLELWSSSLKGNHYRGTVVPQGMNKLRKPQIVTNVWAGNIQSSTKYDGIKMDIEGSEFGIIDEHLIPDCDKLCFEYHTSRDQSMDNMKRRFSYLETLFRKVHILPELQKMMQAGGMQKSWNDRVIFCIGRKKLR